MRNINVKGFGFHQRRLSDIFNGCRLVHTRLNFTKHRFRTRKKTIHKSIIRGKNIEKLVSKRHRNSKFCDLIYFLKKKNFQNPKRFKSRSFKIFKEWWEQGCSNIGLE
jgi:hypothetical protein